ncbi:hypothetical protein GQ53DRAFT_94446 [Thozetella sp. PMI_491]|nr:hypothetical protein GQ53DRAFT_94446 [Thozetella sp. PMI_491]
MASEQLGIPTRRSRQPGRACDRCYAVKAKCRPSGQERCERCLRLGHGCVFSRPVRPLGRPALRNVGIGSSPSQRLLPQARHRFSRTVLRTSRISTCKESTLSSPDASLSLQGLRPVSRLSETERHLIKLCLDPDPDRLIGLFIVGPSFAETQKSALLLRFAIELPLLKDAYLACAGSFAADQAMTIEGLNGELIHKYAASAVQLLRSFPQPDSTNITNLLSIGLAIHTFAHFSFGQSTITVCRYILSLVKPAYHNSLSTIDSDSISFLACIISADIFECLWRCEFPTLRFIDPASGTVDRYLGLCTPLLPLLHDLCELNVASRHADESDFVEILGSLDRIQEELDHWKPKFAPDVLAKLVLPEAVCVLAQCEAFRLVGLLIIHRLRYPYGCNDSMARLLSRAIVQVLQEAKDSSGRTVRGCAYAYVFACMELTDSVARQTAVNNLHLLIGYTSIFRFKMQSLMTQLWRSRDRASGKYWYNLGDELG